MFAVFCLHCWECQNLDSSAHGWSIDCNDPFNHAAIDKKFLKKCPSDAVYLCGKLKSERVCIRIIDYFQGKNDIDVVFFCFFFF